MFVWYKISTQHSAVYHFSKVCVLTSYTGVEGENQSIAKFILPEMKKLSVAIDSGKFCILFISCGMEQNIYIHLKGLNWFFFIVLFEF